MVVIAGADVSLLGSIAPKCAKVESACQGDGDAATGLRNRCLPYYVPMGVLSDSRACYSLSPSLPYPHTTTTRGTHP